MKSLPQPDLGRARQTDIDVTSLSGIKPVVPIAPAALEAIAQHAMSRAAFEGARNTPAHAARSLAP